MGFEKVYITKQGALLAAKTLQGKKIKFDHAEIGSGALTGNAADKTALTTKVLECEISKVEITQDTQASVSFMFKNTDAPNAFNFREIGLFAIDPDTKNKILYAYTNAGNTAEYINNSIAEKIEKHIQINVVVDNASNVTITLDDTQIYVTEKDLLEKAQELTDDYDAKFDNLKSIVVAPNAAAHNAIYRGKDITELFYNGTLSQQIAAGTFDDIFIGDYIIGKVSKRKYLVADINYRLNCGDTECTTPHILMVPERIMGTAKMNDTNTVTGAYTGSKMYTEYLTPFKTVIQNDFEISHILSHKALLTNAVADEKASNWAWFDSTIELMNECMVYGHNAWGSHHGYETGADKSQLSLFRLNASKIVARNDAGERYWYWLRDVASASEFAAVDANGGAGHSGASTAGGVRPAFLIK